MFRLAAQAAKRHRGRSSLIGRLSLGALAVSMATAAPAAAANLPRLPGKSGRLQVRPAVVAVTADGSGYLGGAANRRDVHLTRTNFPAAFGHITWLSWHQGKALGAGAEWEREGTPANPEIFDPYSMSVTAYRARDGVFTRMAVTVVSASGKFKDAVYEAKHYAATRYAPAYWAWARADFS
jgi:hypothetical protein